MRRLFIDEILEQIKKLNTDEEKAKLLNLHDSLPLRQILYANFSKKIKFLLPDVPTPYKKQNCPSDLANANLLKEARKLYLFIAGGHPSLTQMKRESLWIQLLEGLSDREAELLEHLKNKNLEQRYNVTRRSVELAFINLLAPEEATAKPVESVQPTAVAIAEAPVVASIAPAAAEEVKPKVKRARSKKNESPVGTTVQS